MSSPASPLVPPVRSHLPFAEQGDGTGAPIILLHGFGGDHQTWLNIQTGLAPRRRTLAFDLPGHGRALDWPRIGNAGVSAKAVVQSLETLDLAPVHLVGHSMGGAVAALVAMRAPESVASLTLLAPGGFGRDINYKLLRRYAQTASEAELEPLLEQFFGYGFRMPRLFARHAAELRQKPGAIEALTTIVEEILDGDGQKTIEKAALADLGMPVKLIWGRQDRVLPAHQASDLPGTVACHLFDGMGHMPHLENPQAVIRLILEASAAR